MSLELFHLTAVNFARAGFTAETGRAVTDADLERLIELTHLESLNLHHTAIIGTGAKVRGREAARHQSRE